MDIFSIKSKLTDKFITPQMRGAIDTQQLEGILSMADEAGKKGRTLTGLAVPTADGHTTMIDALRINSNGVFIIKIVNQGAFIYGDDTSKNWTTSTLSSGNLMSGNPIEKMHFPNPVIQNDFNMHSLNRFLGSGLKESAIPMFSVLVFPNDAEFKDISLKNIKCCICHLRNFGGQIKRICQVTKKVLSADDICGIYEKLTPLTDRKLIG